MQVTGRDPSKWTFGGWYYNGAFYPSHDAFRAAWTAPTFEKPTRRNVNDTAFSGTDRVGDDLPFDKQAPPMMVQPGGQRFSVDFKEKWVEWGEFLSRPAVRGLRADFRPSAGPFSFFITFTRDTGMRLFDIRFGTSGDSEKKRIIYELGLDEAIAHYAGSDRECCRVALLRTRLTESFSRNSRSIIYGLPRLRLRLWTAHARPPSRLGLPDLRHLPRCGSPRQRGDDYSCQRVSLVC